MGEGPMGNLEEDQEVIECSARDSRSFTGECLIESKGALTDYCR